MEAYHRSPLHVCLCVHDLPRGLSIFLSFSTIIDIQALTQTGADLDTCFLGLAEDRYTRFCFALLFLGHCLFVARVGISFP